MYRHPPFCQTIRLNIMLFLWTILRIIFGSFRLNVNPIHFQHFSDLKQLLKIILNVKICRFCSDNGGEYQKITPYLLNNGITHLTSPPHTPEHNGFVE